MLRSPTLGPRAARLVLTALCATVMLVAIAPGAHAAFTLQPCTGGNASGSGSTLQDIAQQQYWTTSVFAGVTCAGGPTVTYNGNGSPSGSGGGRNAMGALDGVRTGGNACSGNPCNPGGSRFAGSDEPPTPAEQANMNNGPTNATTDDAKIHVIPVAAAAVAVVVHIPAACANLNPATTAGQNFVADQDDSGRLALSDDQLVKAFNHDVSTWGAMLADGGVATGDASCDNTQIHRVVRLDSSGSTFAFKSFLNHAATAQGQGAPFDVSNNQAWPSDDETQTQLSSGVSSCGALSVCRATTGGGPALRQLLDGTDGGIGYLALPDARVGYDFDGTTSDKTYWIAVAAVDNSGTGTPFEPTKDPNGFKSAIALPPNGGPHGSNCLTTPFTHVPTGPNADPTLDDWSAVDGTGATNGYPICTLTYDLAYDDDAAAYGNTSAEQSVARTVKDYLGAIVSDSGQSDLLGHDYVPLSSTALPGRSVSLRQIAQNAVAAIGWNKSADTGGGTPPPTTVATPPATTPIAPILQSPAVVVPSNRFSITSSKISSKKKIVVTLQLPGSGSISVSAKATYKKKSLTVASVKATVGGGKGSITLSPSSAARSALKKVKSLSVTISVTFTPKGGKAAAKTTKLTFKGTGKAKA